MADVVFFDLDGTLTDPAEGICNSFLYALEKCGIHEKDEKRLYSFIGPPLGDSFASYGMNESEVEQAVIWYREYFNRSGKFENYVYPGVPEMLETLQSAGKTLAVATSKLEKFSVEILEHFNLMPYFKSVCGATADARRSRKGDVIRYLLDTMTGCEKQHTVMVGDRSHDIIGAREAGIRSIGVLYGYGDRAELTEAGAWAVAGTVAELPGLIL